MQILRQPPSQALPPTRCRGPGHVAVTVLSAGHALATFVGCLVAFSLNVTACANADAAAHRQLIVASDGGLAAVALAVWGMLAMRWRRPWLLAAGTVAAAPAIWGVADTLTHPGWSCL